MNTEYDFQYWNGQTKKWHLYKDGRVRKCVENKMQGVPVKSRKDKNEPESNSESESSKPDNKVFSILGW